MANNAHFIVAAKGNAPKLIVRDDRGAAVVELDLPPSVDEPGQADEHLRSAGWTRSGSVVWTKADDGWVAPVVPS